MGRVLNHFTIIGLVAYAVTLIAKRVIGPMDFIYGVGHGIALVFLLLGLYARRHNISGFKEFKKKLIKS